MMNRRLHLESLENRQMLTGATQISGAAGFADETTCPGPDPGGPYSDEFSDFDYAVSLTEGNLIGCWYVLITEDPKYSPDEFAEPFVYQERGRELFIGDLYDDDDMFVGTGSFETTYKFTAKYADDSFAEEIHGRCQHPLVNDTGTGVFENVTGRVDFKDDVDAEPITFYYRGHFKPLTGRGPNHNAVDVAIAASLEADDDSRDALFEDTEL